ADKASNERGRDVAAALKETAGNQLAEARQRLAAALETAKASPDVAFADNQTEAARAASERVAESAAVARARLIEAEAAEAEARLPMEEAEHEVQHRAAEVKALGDLLHPEGEGLFPPLIDAVRVQAGYEAALAAVLGDDLQAPLDESAPHHWR